MLLISMLVLGVLFVIFVAWQPSELRVMRSASIRAPADAVFAQINDFRGWKAWSPWANKDPHAKSSYEGSQAGVGAVFRWSGNTDIGEGGMTITECRPRELVRIKLEFVKPFPAVNDVEFRLQPAGGHTSVTWTMRSANNFAAKAIYLFVNMDRKVGGQMEQGLANLRSVVEARRRLRALSP